MAKTTISPARPKEQASADTMPDLEVALSKARAASVLLKADADYLDIPVSLERDSEECIRAWIQDFGFDALDAALEEAEVARQKIPGMTTWWPAGAQKRKTGNPVPAFGGLAGELLAAQARPEGARPVRKPRMRTAKRRAA
jgi:hypothetical protein